MNSKLLFRLDGIILLINGFGAAFASKLFSEGAGITLDANGLTIAQAFGAALIALGIIVFKIPSFVGKMKETIETVILVHLTFVILIGFHLMNGQAEGPTPLINLAFNLLFIILYFSERNKG